MRGWRTYRTARGNSSGVPTLAQCVLRIAGRGIRTTNYELRTTNHELRTTNHPHQHRRLHLDVGLLQTDLNGLDLCGLLAPVVGDLGDGFGHVRFEAVDVGLFLGCPRLRGGDPLFPPP